MLLNSLFYPPNLLFNDSSPSWCSHPQPLIYSGTSSLPQLLLRQWEALSRFSLSYVKGTKEREDMLSSSLPLAPCYKTSVFLTLPEKC